MTHIIPVGFCLSLLAVGLAGCGEETTSGGTGASGGFGAAGTGGAAGTAGTAGTGGSESPDIVGGRLFDKWFAEGPLTGTFAPDAAATPGVPDGMGGPNMNGTLNSALGTPILNDAGHDYRLKNFFGWDLRGSEGVYGPMYQNKAYVVGVNLLTTPLDVSMLLTAGSTDVPAYGPVLGADNIAKIVDLVNKMRAGTVPKAADIWDLSTTAPNKYTLRAGANPAHGKELIGGTCADLTCHGVDGTKVLFDDGEYSLGTLSRAAGYEVWIKILSGQPGSLPAMTRQASTAQDILDILAALCDRTAFPQGTATVPDVQPGDPRCGPYLL